MNMYRICENSGRENGLYAVVTILRSLENGFITRICSTLIASFTAVSQENTKWTNGRGDFLPL